MGRGTSVEEGGAPEVIAAVVAAAKQHPLSKLVRRYIAYAILFGVLATFFGGVVPAAPIAFLFACAAGLYAWAAWANRRTLHHVMLANRAIDARERGLPDQAAALLGAVSSKASRYVKRMVHVERAKLALGAHDGASAIAHASAAIEAPFGLLTRELERIHLQVAHGLRALARAQRQDHEAARSDIERARAADHAIPASLTYAALASGVVAANEGRKDELREILAREAPFLDDLSPKNRALLRRLERAASSKERTIYRHPARPEEWDAVDWGPTALREPEAAPTEAAKRRVAKLPGRRRLTQRWRLLLLWVLLVLVFLAVWQVLNPSAPAPSPPPAPEPDPPWWVAWAIVSASTAAMVGFTLWNARRLARRRRDALASSVALMRHETGARERTEKLAKAGLLDASWALATHARKQGDFSGALAICEGALARASSSMMMRIASFDTSAPALAAERAFCLAALDRSDEANAALEAMPNRENYALSGAAHFRVRLAQALRRGDTKAALAVAAQRGDLTLSAQEELLLDLLRAKHGRGASDEEWARLQRELADPAKARWVQHFLPEASTKVRASSTDAELRPDEEVEDEGAAARTPALPQRSS